MREGSSSKAAVRGMFVLSFAGIIAKFIAVFYTPILRNVLGLAGFGAFNKTTEVFLFVYALTSLGSQPAVAKVVSELTALDNPKGANRALKIANKFYFVLGGGVGILMMTLAIPFTNLIGIPDTAYGIIALGPCVLITAILSVYRGYMQGRNNMTAIAISQILEQIIHVVVSLLAAFILVQASENMGNVGAQIGTLVGAIFAVCYLIYVFEEDKYSEESLNEADTYKHISDKKILKKIIKYSIPITLSSGLQNFGGLVDMANVTNRLAHAGFDNNTANILYAWLGQYKTLYGVPLIIITAIGTTMLPSIARSMVLNEKKQVKRNIAEAFKLTYSISIPAAVGLSMLSQLIYISLYGDDIGYKMMVYGSFVMVLMATTQIQSVVMQGINKLYYILGTFCIGILVKIIINYIFVGITDINIYGVIIGNCFWHLIPAVLNHRKICSLMKMRMPLGRLMIKPIIASIFMAIAIYLCMLPLDFVYRFIDLTRIIAIPITVILVTVGGFVYLYSMIVMGGITKSDIEIISPKVMKFMPRFMRMKLR